ncbi:interleukin-15 isoform X1 [Arapaima gigas]
MEQIFDDTKHLTLIHLQSSKQRIAEFPLNHRHHLSQTAPPQNTSRWGAPADRPPGGAVTEAQRNAITLSNSPTCSGRSGGAESARPAAVRHAGDTHAVRMTPLVIALCLTVIAIQVLRRDCKTKRRTRRACVLRCCCCCQSCQSHCDVWIALLVLSCLSTSMTLVEASEEQALRELQSWVAELTPQLRGSDTTSYTPSNEDIPEECTHAAMQCYLLELEVILFENNVEDEDENIKLRKNNSLQLKSSCLPCEAHQEANSTVFLQRFQEFLQRLMSNLPYVCCVFLQMHNPHSHFSCI